MAEWLNVQDVAQAAGASPTDPELVAATDAAETWVELHRSDLDWSTPALGETPEGPHVYQGAVLFAVNVFQAGASPDGFPGFDDAGGFTAGAGDNASMSRVYRLLRGRRPRVG